MMPSRSLVSASDDYKMVVRITTSAVVPSILNPFNLFITHGLINVGNVASRLVILKELDKGVKVNAQYPNYVIGRRCCHQAVGPKHYEPPV